MAQPAAQLTAQPAASRNNAFTVGVKLLSDRFFHVAVGPLDTVSALKQRIFEREGAITRFSSLSLAPLSPLR